MRLHAGQLEDVPGGTQRGCDVPKTSFARWGERTFCACSKALF